MSIRVTWSIDIEPEDLNFIYLDEHGNEVVEIPDDLFLAAVDEAIAIREAQNTDDDYTNALYEVTIDGETRLVEVDKRTHTLEYYNG